MKLKLTLCIALTTLLLLGCSTFENKKVEITKFGPDGVAESSWKLNVPSESRFELITKEGDTVVYDGRSSNFIKDLLILKAVQTDINISNKEGN